MQLVLVDTGADDHVCPETFLPDAESWDDGGATPPVDAQGGQLSTGRMRKVFLLAGFGARGAPIPCVFRVGKTRAPILSAGKLARAGFHVSLGPDGGSLARGSLSVRLEVHRSSLWLPCHAFATAQMAEEAALRVAPCASALPMAAAAGVDNDTNEEYIDPATGHPDRLHQTEQYKDPLLLRRPQRFRRLRGRLSRWVLLLIC